MLPKIIFFSAVIVFVVAEKVRYDNYALYKVHTQNEEDFQFLKDLQKKANGFDFWNPPARIGDEVSGVSSPGMREEFEHTLKKRSIHSEMILENIQEAFDAQLRSRKKRGTNRQLYWTNYQTMEEIYEWFDHLAETYPDIVSLITVGQTYERRNITGIKISKRSGRRSFFLEGGQVGADWLSPTVLTYIVDQLIRGEDPEARAASEDFDWHIFPIVNPDGHNFSQESVRLWMKNRSPIARTSPQAYGVDLTRNWNSHWGVLQGSFNPANDNYVGLGPFSELETRSLSRYIESISSEMVGLLSFRAFGQRLLIPFAHTTEHLNNYQDMVTIGRRAMGSLAVRYNTQYLVGTSGEVHDGATGILADWAKYRFNTPIVATYQLRDRNFGYTLPVDQVKPSCEETLDSLMAIIREARYMNVL